MLLGTQLNFKYFIPVFICITILVCTYQQGIIFPRIAIHENLVEEVLVDKTVDVGVFTINTPGCKIPYFQPFDKNILDYLEQPGTHVCNDGIPALFESDRDSITIIEDSLPFYNVTNINNLTCCYKTFWREDPDDDAADNKISYSKHCQTFVNKTEVKQEFIKVKCSYNNRRIYKDMFVFVPIKNLSDTQKDLDKNDDYLNILVIGLDSISRLNFHRQMPKSVNYLKQIGAVEMIGYNKIGENTFPNVLAALAGRHIEEIQKDCWPTDNHHFDNCSFVWMDYKQKGYVTAFDEDSSSMGIFNFYKKGFKKQPTDYGYNYFDREAMRRIGNTAFENVQLCQGARWVHKEHLKYMTNFIRTMKENSLKYFGFFWENSISHDDLNLPRIGDDDYYAVFKYLKENGHLNNTVLFVMSDHGIRWGGIRSTFQGMMEERLPFLYVYLPEWYRHKYQQLYNNLQKNSLLLTTPFDLHETFVDLLNIENIDNNNNSINTSRGVSLLRGISEYRTCEDTGIVSHWCTCQKSVELDVNNQTIKTVANFCVNYINDLLSEYPKCADLKLDRISSARVMEHSQEITGDFQVSDYMLSFTTVPGNGSFEATVRYMSKSKTYTIVGSISRLNLYGEQSACISDYELKLYCYCT
ncbi:uncharacterized protein LOC126888178 [Diabrotica virgifera virgifera]|uniref:Uncharacterized protein n=1 Tax=Diabrotica virgifera virgifera TaxID=50390 RepID=A0ABM5KPL2_DIAVI|nr:uncharacterized protein LOC126888178 [Diabrotica virgifera virgifera]